MKRHPQPSSFSITSNSSLRQQRIQMKNPREADSPLSPFFGVMVSHLFSLSPSFPYCDSCSTSPPTSALFSAFGSFCSSVNRGAGEANTQLKFLSGQFRSSHLEKTSDVKVSRVLGEEWTDGKAEGFGVSWKLCLHKNNLDYFKEQ